jgi:hypothetical protein
VHDPIITDDVRASLDEPERDSITPTWSARLF